MIEVLISIKIPNIWVCELTEKYPIKLRFLSCMPLERGGRAVVEVYGEEEILEKSLKEIVKDPSISIVSPRGGKRIVSCEGAPEDCEACMHIITSGCFLVTPFSGEAGYMDWLLVTDKKESLSSLFENLKKMNCNVKIKRIVDLKEKRILTEKQENIVKYALRNGYFKFPKKIGMRKIAREFDISIATVSEILRNAQQKVLKQYFEKQ